MLRSLLNVPPPFWVPDTVVDSPEVDAADGWVMTAAGFVSTLVVSAASATIGDDKLDATSTESATVPIIFDFFLFIFFYLPSIHVFRYKNGIWLSYCLEILK
jgi:hypothetical protein